MVRLKRRRFAGAALHQGPLVSDIASLCERNQLCGAIRIEDTRAIADTHNDAVAHSDGAAALAARLKRDDGYVFSIQVGRLGKLHRADQADFLRAGECGDARGVGTGLLELAQHRDHRRDAD